MATRSDSWSLILLTGGTARRLDGIYKATVDLAGTTPLELLLEALPPGVPVIAAGDPVTTSRPILFRREDPPGGGPAAGIAAALPSVSTDLTAIIAVDMPWAMPTLERALETLASDTGADAVMPVDPSGRRQPLCSAWRTAALRRAVDAAGVLANRPVRDLLADAAVVDLPVVAGDDSLADIDTAEDLEQARRRAQRP